MDLWSVRAPFLLLFHVLPVAYSFRPLLCDFCDLEVYFSHILHKYIPVLFHICTFAVVDLVLCVTRLSTVFSFCIQDIHSPFQIVGILPVSSEACLFSFARGLVPLLFPVPEKLGWLPRARLAYDVFPFCLWPHVCMNMFPTKFSCTFALAKLVPSYSYFSLCILLL